jgi:hypothetical protein
MSGDEYRCKRRQPEEIRQGNRQKLLVAGETEVAACGRRASGGEICHVIAQISFLTLWG